MLQRTLTNRTELGRKATYTLLAGERPEVEQHVQPIRISHGEPVIRQVPASPKHERPSEPPGREPPERRRTREETASG